MEDVDCIRLAQGRDTKWRALVNTGINSEYHKVGEISWLPVKTVAA
jgi:hypothetical protein